MCADTFLLTSQRNREVLREKKYFWRYARSTIESELKDNITFMKRLENRIFDDLFYYSLERSNSIYFNFTTKCYIVENNMVGCFITWILTLITMLEENSLKVIKSNKTNESFAILETMTFLQCKMKVLQVIYDLLLLTLCSVSRSFCFYFSFSVLKLLYLGRSNFIRRF